MRHLLRFLLADQLVRQMNWTAVEDSQNDQRNVDQSPHATRIPLVGGGAKKKGGSGKKYERPSDTLRCKKYKNAQKEKSKGEYEYIMVSFARRKRQWGMEKGKNLEYLREPKSGDAQT